MRSVSVIENVEGLFLMNTMNGPIDWTDKWEHAVLYPTPERAKSDRDYLGITLCDVKTYELIPPVPKSDPVREDAARMRKELTRVYLISEKPTDKNEERIRCFKIGFSKDPMKRVKQLQTGHPHKIGLEGWFNFKTEKEAREFEKALHEHFKEKRMGGEWFRFDHDVQFFITDAHYNCENFERVLT